MHMLFWIFLALMIGMTLLQRPARRKTFLRSSEDWWIDLVNLVIHLVGLPLFQTFVLFKFLNFLAPSMKAQFELGALGSLGLYVILDYLWYWNHRWLHSYSWIWNLHAVHHSAKQVDVFSSARNSVWSHFFEIYLWFIAGAIYLLEDPSWFIAFVVLGSISNFWIHTELTFARSSLAYRWISKILITPHEHLWHHSTSHSNKNFGTVFSIWDQVHGTFHAPESLPSSYGNEYIHGAFKQLVLPIKKFDH